MLPYHAMGARFGREDKGQVGLHPEVDYSDHVAVPTHHETGSNVFLFSCLTSSRACLMSSQRCAKTMHTVRMRQANVLPILEDASVMGPQTRFFYEKHNMLLCVMQSGYADGGGAAAG